MGWASPGLAGSGGKNQDGAVGEHAEGADRSFLTFDKMVRCTKT